jgi:hypothetical protein
MGVPTPNTGPGESCAWPGKTLAWQTRPSASGETYLPDGKAESGWCQPVPRGLERKNAEKMAFLKSLDVNAGKG